MCVWTSLTLIAIIALQEIFCVTVTEVRLVSPHPYVLAGEPAVLTCHYLIDESELVTEVEWEMDDALVYLWTLDEGPVAKGVLEGRVDATVNSPSTLPIAEVTMQMQGTYKCRVRTNGRMAENELFLMVIVDACKENVWKTYSDMIECTETINMHCYGIFPKPSPACGIYADKEGRFLNSVPFDSVNKLANGTYELSLNRRFLIQDWNRHPDISFRCHLLYLGTPWRSGITHKMFGEPGCREPPPQIENGHYNLTEEHSCWNFSGEGSRAEYYCGESYRLTGSPLYICVQGHWAPDGVVSDEAVEVPFCEDPNKDDSGSSAVLCHLELLIMLFIGWTFLR